MPSKVQLTDSYGMLPRLQYGLFIGVFFILVYAVRSGAFASVLGVGILAAGAFLLAGFLMGFIFAIPRIGAAPAHPQGSGSDSGQGDSASALKDPAKSRVSPNSNLVEISDWLTKIIVGVGLVQLNKIPGKLGALVSYLASGLRKCDSAACLQSSQALALAIIIFYSAAGFLIGYLWARLYFERDLENSLAGKVDAAWQYTEKADQAINDGNWKGADANLDKALSIDPYNAKAHVLKGYVLKRLAVEGGTMNKALLKEALDHATQAARLNPTIAGAFYNVACYQALLGMDRGRILANLKLALQKDPSLKRAAQEDARDGDLNSLASDEAFKALIS
jgi:hypothetical protein